MTAKADLNDRDALLRLQAQYGSSEKIAPVVGVSAATVQRAMRRLGVAPKPQPRSDVTPAQLVDALSGRTRRQAAKLLGVAPSTVTALSTRYGVGQRISEPIPVGITEIAERLGVERPTVDMWRHRGLLPDPRWTVGGRPAWNWADIAAWASSTGRGSS